MTEHPNLSAALVAALAELTVVEKGRTANAGSYKYEYADLGDIIKEARPKLAAHGLAVLTPVSDHGDGLAVSVLLLHSSGERMEFGPLSFPHGRDAQATGSLITYHRRYALLSALGMATGDDDDGASAVPRQNQPKQSKPAPLPQRLPDHVIRLRDAMDGIEDEPTRVAVKKAFFDQFGKPQDVIADDADTAEMFIVDMLAELAAGQQEEPTSGPGPTADAPPAPAPVTKPATKSPAAAARAALNGDKPTIGAVRNNPVPDEEVQAHFPGSEVVDA